MYLSLHTGSRDPSHTLTRTYVHPSQCTLGWPNQSHTLSYHSPIHGVTNITTGGVTENRTQSIKSKRTSINSPLWTKSCHTQSHMDINATLKSPIWTPKYKVPYGHKTNIKSYVDKKRSLHLYTPCHQLSSRNTVTRYFLSIVLLFLLYLFDV